MKTFLNETQAIDSHLQGSESPEATLLFEAKLLLDPQLLETFNWQKQTYALVRAYSRAKLKSEIEAVHLYLFTQPEHKSFRKRIHALFSTG